MRDERHFYDDFTAREWMRDEARRERRIYLWRVFAVGFLGTILAIGIALGLS